MERKGSQQGTMINSYGSLVFSSEVPGARVLVLSELLRI
jgi:hypothetical protein